MVVMLAAVLGVLIAGSVMVEANSDLLKERSGIRGPGAEVSEAIPQR